MIGFVLVRALIARTTRTNRLAARDAADEATLRVIDVLAEHGIAADSFAFHYRRSRKASGATERVDEAVTIRPRYLCALCLFERVLVARTAQTKPVDMPRACTDRLGVRIIAPPWGLTFLIATHVSLHAIDLLEGSRVMRFAIARNFLESASSYSETLESFKELLQDSTMRNNIVNLF